MEKNMNGALLVALERIEREKGIDKEVLFEAIESALVSAARKVIDDPDISKEDIEVVINRETGSIEVYSEGLEVQSEKFGRIAAQTAKQVMIQKIREAERDVIFNKYSEKTGSIISGAVHRFEKGNIIVELDDTEAIIPKQHQIPRERFRQGETIRALLLKVEKTSSGPAIMLSRSDAGFVKKLFEFEVPEITQGIVEINAIAREAGERTKIAVYSKDDKVDAVGACVGMRGSRVRDIVKELNGERIDIVRWNDDIREFLPAAVSPAEISRMLIDRENKTITLTVARDQLSLLIGKKGRNIRLASRLVGWELAAEAARMDVNMNISDVKGIGAKSVQILEENGYDTVNRVLDLGEEKLVLLNGIGEKTAKKIFDSCNDAYKKVVDAMAKLVKEKEDVSSDKNESDSGETEKKEEFSSDDGEETDEAPNVDENESQTEQKE
jgi:N utilization substance protein A